MIKKTYPLWISHTSLRDFLTCPRAYFLRQIYKDPVTRKKINIISPALALGNTVHEVLESLSELPVEKRFERSLLEMYEKEWKKVAGDLGGFADEQEEKIYKERGKRMIEQVIAHPGPIGKKALKLHSPDTLPPRYLISEDENIMLCGKIDWLEYFEEDDSVHIIDFKTGVHEEDADSLQLPIYALLVKNLQKRKINKISYWYLDRDITPTEMALPDLEKAHEKVLSLALQVKEARKERAFACPKGGCFACKPFEQIVSGNARFVKTIGYQDIYAV